ncbi:flippase-like domain-containing protein [Enterococcus sp. BWB1-3]|uniref:lysylphosphatidylglycerol synthase transmembrane domain-containing protein n=1 Tax=Enterococcus sp. BWB1-3 TaxID=2787713 RepID=UPI001922D921|nr:lysylphosphatidylglycerol synthase domain-containing protein [Enterococcus sp. BWB1-3]MBL1229447.1 flippase-like domain-containing protein [Enterococcus sp. BWB1-3]
MKNKPMLKIIFNVILMLVMIGIVFYVIDNSLSSIFAQLLKTSVFTLLAVVGLGVFYQIVEGRSIKEIVYSFQPDFTTKDGFFASCYVAFYRIVSFGTGTLVSEVLYYRKKALATSQAIGITALHMIMYKLAVIFLAVLGLIFQFPLLYSNAPMMIPFILASLIFSFLIVVVILALSISIRLQVFLTVWADKHIKRPKLRDWVDQWNIQIYSLRDTVQTVIKDHSAMIRIFMWNVGKVLIWLVIPYVALVEHHSSLDLLLTLSYTSFAIVLAGVIPTPAGIGSFEFVYLLLFKPLVGTVDAVSSLLLYRFGSFVLPFLIGMVYVMIEKRKEIKKEIVAVRKEEPSK